MGALWEECGSEHKSPAHRLDWRSDWAYGCPRFHDRRSSYAPSSSDQGLPLGRAF